MDERGGGLVGGGVWTRQCQPTPSILAEKISLKPLFLLATSPGETDLDIALGLFF